MSKRNMLSKENKNYFSNMTILFSAVTVAVIIILALAVTITFTKRTEAIITDTGGLAIEQLSDATDAAIFEGIDELCEKYFDERAESQEFMRFFNDMQNLSVADMEDMRKSLSAISEENKYINSITLYNGHYDTAVSTDDGVVIDISYASDDNLSIKSLFFALCSNIENDFYVPQDYNVMTKNTDNSILYVHYMPKDESIVLPYAQSDCVIMNINIDNIVNFMMGSDSLNVYQFMILDSENRVLIHNGISEEEPNAAEIIMQNPIYSKIQSNVSGAEYLRLAGTGFNCIWRKSRVRDWTYIYLVSSGVYYKQILSAIIIAALISLMVMIAASLAIRYLSGRAFLPYNKILERVSANMEYDSPTDKAPDMLNSFISSFSLTKSEYKQVTEKYKLLGLERLSSDIIHGYTADNHDQLSERLESFGVSFTKDYFCLILLEFNPLALKGFTTAENDYILNDLAQALRDGFDCIAAITSMNTVAIVLNGDADEFDARVNDLRIMIPEEALVNIYKCRYTENLADIAEMYVDASKMLKYSYVYGFDNTFSVERLTEQERDTSSPERKTLIDIETALRDGNKERFCDKCNELFNKAVSDGHSYDYVQSTVTAVFSALCRVAKEKQLVLNDDDAFKAVVENDYFDNSTCGIFELSDRIFNEMSNKTNERKSELINNILEYIDTHITEDISLVSVAQHFGLSAGYLSKFFKDNSDESFSKHVIRKKFEYAAKTLSSDPTVTVSDIANRLGYFDAAYFTRQFKLYYGMTPTQYRKTHSNK